jgi:glycosyltransferase involved in cell wall biosynthesis
MRIALFHNLPSGGAKRHTFEQMRELSKRGHEIVEFAPSTADLLFCSLEPHVREQRVYPVPSAPPAPRRIPFVTPYLNALRGVATLRQTASLNQVIARDIDACGFEVVLVKDCRIALKPHVLRFLRTRSVFQCHHALPHRAKPSPASLAARAKAMYYWPATRFYQRRFDADEARNVRSAWRVLTSSAFTQHVLAEQYRVASHVVYPGIDTAVFHPVEAPVGNSVVSAGALTYQKGHRFVVSAVARIPAERRPPLRILANSSEPEEERAVRSLASRLAVDLRIEQVHDDAALARAYGSAAAFAFAPIDEALGMAPLEAAACGTPVVAVAEGGVRETMRDGVTGWLVERDEQAFADRLMTLISDSHARTRLAASGMNYVRQNWTWKSAVDRLEEHLQAAAGVVVSH